MRSSTDGGRHFTSWPALTEPVTAAAAGGDTLWLTVGGRVWTARGGAPQMLVEQPGFEVQRVFPIGGATAVAQLGSYHSTWRITNDRGAHWADLADPCGAGDFRGSDRVELSIAADGTWVSACGPVGGGGGSVTIDIAASTDQGRTWTERNKATFTGNSSRYFQAGTGQVLWFGGARMDTYRATDGGGAWKKVAVTGDAVGAGMEGFVVLDANTAVYGMLHADGDTPALYLTRDGGASWQQLTLPQ